MPHLVTFFIVDGFHLLDLSGPLSVIREANDLRPDSYQTAVVSPSGGEVQSQNGLAVMTGRIKHKPVHTLFIVGGSGPRLAATDANVVAAVQKLASRSSRIVSICTGAFLLAATGLLDGRRATTHWKYAAELQRRFPAVRVDADCIFIEDGPVWTSAGITAGIDLALALLETDLDTALAKEIAHELVVYHRRPGSQTQASTLLNLEPQTDRLRKVWSYAGNHLRENLSVEGLAEIAALSPRQFTRAFRAETGQSPAKAVERLRVEAARTRLENGTEALETVASAVGFSSAAHLRKAFLRVMGQPPQAFRREARSKRQQRRFHIMSRSF